jgi:hypothetical protein
VPSANRKPIEAIEHLKLLVPIGRDNAFAGDVGLNGVGINISDVEVAQRSTV